MSYKDSLFNEISGIPLKAGRLAFIETVKKIEKSILASLKEEVLAGWSLGKGIGTSNELSVFRDSILGMIIEYSGGIPEGITVAAVGGYGRGELSPYSDIDLLILHKDRAPVENFVHKFVTNLWDCGYHIGYSVRTIDNLIEHAREDIEFLTSLFEARFIKGDLNLYSSMETATSKLIGSFRVSYLKSQMEQLNSLIGDPANKILLKEPDIKKSIGGLRSVHLMEWLNFTFTMNKGLAGLKLILPKIYYKKTYVAYDFLLFIRCALHIESGRKNDRLLMNDQFSLSGLFFTSGGEEARTEKLMKKYYSKSEDIFLSLLFIIDEFHLRFIRSYKSLRGGRGKGNTIEGNYRIINKRFYIRGWAGFTAENAFQALYIYCKKGCFFTFSLLNYLRECARKMSEEDKKSRNIFYLFRKILSLENASSAIIVMKYSGLLYEYIPPFKKIWHLIIYNPYHQFTVDEHAFESVRAFTALKLQGILPDAKNRIKFSHFSEVGFYYKKNIWIIRLALLLHDIGKAYEGDHSKNGVEMADKLFKILPITSMARELILFLIDNHLLLSNLIRRSNIADKTMLRDLAGRFILTPFPKEYFDALYILTYCDIYATKPENFKSYMAELLTLLYRNLIPYLSRKLMRTENIVRSPDSSGEFGSFIREMGPSYTAQNQESEIHDDYSILNSMKEAEIRIKVRSYNDYFKVKMFSSDRKGLFSYFCGILTLNGADIVRAEVRTYKDVAVDEFTVTRIFGIDYMENMKDELNIWTKDLEKLLGTYQFNAPGLEQAIESMKKKIKKSPAVFSRKPDILLENRGGGACTLEISGMDRPALLFDTAGYISKNGIEIQSAHIDTMGWYVHDIFELKTGERLKDDEINRIREELIQILNQQ